VRLPRADMLKSKPIGLSVEVFRECFYCVQVSAYGSLRVIPTPEFLQHHFSELGHRDLLVTHNLPLLNPPLLLYTTRAASAARAASFKRGSRKSAEFGQ
jgi:hypothetical protein